MLPNFLIIGAARCGTTTLYSHLQGHPDIYVPVNKRPEPHFFYKNAEYKHGLAYYEQRYFSAWRGQKAIGEASTSYVFGPEVPRRVHMSLPGVRLICMLRNPVERAFSSYWHTVKSGLENLPFSEAIACEVERKTSSAGTPLGEIAPFAYVERGLYHRQLVRWLKVFDRAQMSFVILDDLVAAPKQTLAEIASFLGIAPEGLPKREIELENKSVPNEASMPPETRRLLVELFRDDVRALGDLLHRDLDQWIR